MLQPTLF